MAAACPLPWARGTPIRIHRMAEALVERRHEVHVVTYPLGDESQHAPYTLHRVAPGYRRLDPRPGPSWAKLLYLDPKLGARLKALIETGNFDVLHAHHYEGLIAALLARRLSRCIPLVFDAHTLLQSELPYYRTGLPGHLAASIGRLLDRRLPPRADHVITVSERMHDWLRENTPLASGEMSVVPNGVELAHFTTAGDVEVSQDASPHIVFAGNLAGYQGIDLLLPAFATVLARYPRARLSLLTGSASHELRAPIEALGLGDAVRFSDPDYADLPARLGEADVLVNPRIDCDGIPQKLLNYMAAGRPIVSFEGSATLLEHEVNALVVPDGDIEGFAHAVLRLLQSPGLAQALGRAAQEKVVGGYGWNKVAERVEAVYEHATGRCA